MKGGLGLAGLTKKEKTFCVEFVSSGNIAEAERNARLEGKGKLLLCRKDICDELQRLSSIQSKSLEMIARAGLKRLAIGGVSDAVRLIFLEKPGDEELDSLDLFNISEIRRKGEQTEIKFFDRFKALEKLLEGSQNEGNSMPFYDALIKCADSLADECDGD